jgi:beta-aspartyl-dipeptidase (metallo-type)
VEEDLPRWLRFYEENEGDFSRLTASSDAAISSPRTLSEQVRAAVTRHHFPLERVLPLVTQNTARVLHLDRKGTIEVGKSADLLLLARDTLEVVHVHARGEWVVRDGSPVKRSRWLDGNKREFHMVGSKARATGHGGGPES